MSSKSSRMSFTIINGRAFELLEPEKEELYPDFFEPKPVSPKKNSNILFADTNGNIHFTFKEIPRKPVIRRRPNVIMSEIPSILGKRKLADAFGEQIYNEKERYGQDIPTDFFKTNIGHGVYSHKPKQSINESELIDWCYKYLASKTK